MVKQTWRSRTSPIGNLVSIRDSASSALGSMCALKCMFPQGTWMVALLESGQGVSRKCCHAGGALLLFAWGWFRTRKPPNTPASSTAHPVALSGFTSPNSPRLPPRHGRGAMGSPRPKSKLPCVASKTRLPKPPGPGIGRCNNAAFHCSIGMYPAISRDFATILRLSSTAGWSGPTPSQRGRKPQRHCARRTF